MCAAAGALLLHMQFEAEAKAQQVEELQAQLVSSNERVGGPVPCNMSPAYWARQCMWASPSGVEVAQNFPSCACMPTCWVWFMASCTKRLYTGLLWLLRQLCSCVTHTYVCTHMHPPSPEQAIKLTLSALSLVQPSASHSLSARTAYAPCLPCFPHLKTTTPQFAPCRLNAHCVSLPLPMCLQAAIAERDAAELAETLRHELAKGSGAAPRRGTAYEEGSAELARAGGRADGVDVQGSVGPAGRVQGLCSSRLV